jgi:hypothetical protein
VNPSLFSVRTMPKARKIQAKINRQNISLVQQAIRGFLSEREYAKKEEIEAFLRSDESLPLVVRKKAQHFCDLTVQAPVFLRISVINEYDEHGQQTILWKNNEEWVDWRTAYRARTGV